MEVIATNNFDNLIAGDFPRVTDPITIAQSQTLAVGAAIGKVLAAAGDADPDESNTGDGAISAFALAAGGPQKVGIYKTICAAAGLGGVAAGSATPDGSNTGNGLVTAFAKASSGIAKVGDYILKCINAKTGGTSSGATAFSGTGNGTAGAVVPGLLAIAGDYIITCIDATVSGSEIFEVIDPNGDMLETLTVGVAYLNDHFGLTISDGSTDFIVGDVWTLTMTIAHGGKFKLTDPDGIDLLEDITLPGTTLGTIAVEAGGIEFTLNDGSTDYAVDDFFTLDLTATEAGGGTFNVYDPSGILIGQVVVAVTFTGGGITFLISEGTTNFIVGDFFTMEVEAGSGQGKAVDDSAVDGTQFIEGILEKAITTGVAETVVTVIDITGEFNERTISFASGTAAAYKAAARLKSIFFKSSVSK